MNININMFAMITNSDNTVKFPNFLFYLGYSNLDLH